MSRMPVNDPWSVRLSAEQKKKIDDLIVRYPFVKRHWLVKVAVSHYLKACELAGHLIMPEEAPVEQLAAEDKARYGVTTPRLPPPGPMPAKPAKEKRPKRRAG
jgi:hypothetical protein